MGRIRITVNRCAKLCVRTELAGFLEPGFVSAGLLVKLAVLDRNQLQPGFALFPSSAYSVRFLPIKYTEVDQLCQ